MLLQFIARASDSAAIIMGVLFVVLALIVIVSAKRGGGNRKTKEVRKGNLKKLAKQYNLGKQHIQLLQQAVREQQIVNVYQFFHNMGYLNRATQKIIERVEHSTLAQKNKVQTVALAFELRRRIEDKFSRMKNSQKKGQTYMLRPGQEITVYAANSPPGRSRVVGNLEDRLPIEVPRGENGYLLKYKRGSVLKIRLIAQGYSYAFTTKLRKFQIINGVESMLVDHSTEVQYNQLRKDQRKETNLVANFQQIEIITTGAGTNAAKQAVVRKQTNFGKIEDISKGGCALFSRKSLAAGKLIKISFNIGTGEDISVFGKVRNTVTRTSPVGVLMHIVFTRVSQQHMNEIQGYVYDLSKI